METFGKIQMVQNVASSLDSTCANLSATSFWCRPRTKRSCKAQTSSSIASLIQPVTWLCGCSPRTSRSRASKRKAETQRVVENPSRTVSLPLPCFRFFRISKVQLRMFLSLPNPPIKSGKVGFPHLRKPVAPPLPEFFFKPFRRPLPITVLTRKLPPEWSTKSLVMDLVWKKHMT